MIWTIKIGTEFAISCMTFPIRLMGLFMKLTPDIAAIALYIIRVYTLSFIPLAVNIFAIDLLQAFMCLKAAELISLLGGLVLNTLLLFVLPLFLGGKGIWWAVLLSEMLVFMLAAACLLMKFEKYRQGSADHD